MRAILTFLLTMILTVASVGVSTAQPMMPAPDPDPFYVPPPDFAARKPGDVLRVREMPWNLYFPTSRVWQVLFRSTDSTGKPIAGNTTFVRPNNHAPDAPLASYQHIINSLGHKCKIATELYTSDLTNQIREAPGLNLALLRGWAVALPDHLGPRMSYGAAKLGGQITLDGIRAVKQLPEFGVTRSKVGLAGYSGGGMATAWAAALAPSYAPELEIVGAAAGGVPMNLSKMAQALGGQSHVAFGLAAAAALGLEREYPDRINVQGQLNDQGRFLAQWINNGCTNEIMFWGFLRSAGQLTDNRDFMNNPEGWKVLDENSLELYQPVPKTPIYEWHSPTDALIPVDSIDNTLRRYCAAGVKVTSLLTPTPDHLSAAVLGLVPGFEWMEQRFRGVPAPSNC